MNVISCSRRTDIPRWHTHWLEKCLERGEAKFLAPRGGKRSVSLQPDEVHSLVLWSKDYSRLLAGPHLLRHIHKLNPYFQFTITGLGGSSLEPEIPSWEKGLAQMGRLVDEFGPHRVNWRFDPVVHWHIGGSVRSNLPLFEEIAPAVTALGVHGCTFSFACWYRKSRTRIRHAGITAVEPVQEDKLAACREMAGVAGRSGLALSSCAQHAWTEIPGVTKARCIDAGLLERLKGGGFAPGKAKDTSQRRECLCTSSVDIGSYSQRCGGAHCLYCYAN